MDSKPKVMDRLDRRLIQLQIEREAVRREKDEASQKRFGLIEGEIAKLQKEIADYDEIWQAEKAQAQGSAHVREEIDKIKFQIAEFTSKGDFNKVAEAAARRQLRAEGHDRRHHRPDPDAGEVHLLKA